MSTATALDYDASAAARAATGGRSHFLLRRLHSLTGLVFGGYLIVHLLVNATLIEGSRHDGGPTVFQTQVDKIHSLPFLPVIETVAIYLPILFHTIYGMAITFSGRSNVGHYPYGKNWFYLFQRISAIVLVLFMLFHILAMKGVFGGDVGKALTFAPLAASESTVRHFQARWWIGYVVYPIGILASCYHLANGFWTAAITWGVTVSDGAQRRWGYACGGLFALTFAAGMTALVATLTADAKPVPPGLDTEGTRVPVVETTDKK